MVVERLTHPHEDDVGHGKAQGEARDGNLRHDLDGGEIAQQSHPPSLAEAAALRTADLVRVRVRAS